MEPSELTFEEWVALARTDPEAFEAGRRKLIDQFLENSPRRQRALGMTLQHEIDYERDRAPNPQASLEHITRMLCLQLLFLGEGLQSLRDALRRHACDRFESQI